MDSLKYYPLRGINILSNQTELCEAILMTRTYFSVHIPKTFDGSDDIVHDIEVFNSAVHTAFVLNQRDNSFGVTRKEQGLPDRRTAEGKKLIVDDAPSVFLQIRKRFGLGTYFANSAVNEASAVLKSVKELHAANVKEVKEQIASVKARLRKTDKRLEQLEKTKGDIVSLSKYMADPHGRRPRLRMPKGSTETFDKKAGTFSIWHYDKKHNARKLIRKFADVYQFETQYLDVKISTLRRRACMLQNRIRHLEAKLASMEDVPGVCFGGKAFFKKQYTVYADDHDTWLRVFRKMRTRGMTISGRKDSINGNYVFRYDPASNTLYYTSMSGKVIAIPKVKFPHGQDVLKSYLAMQAKERVAPIAWRIENSGGSFLIKFSLSLPEPKYKNHCFDNGCIGMDMNVDCFALCETDACGNLLHHWIIPFDLEGKTSEQAEHILSNALEQVFAICDEAKKPLAIEDLKDVANTTKYGSKLRNRKVSSFAHTKMTGLAMSKSDKYCIAVKKVNPAYTSQIGKVKYMSRYGLSVHESAAMVIARRAMGLKDRMPKRYIAELPKEKLPRHHWAHWRHFLKDIRKSRICDLYRRRPRAPCPDEDDLPF